ncbi:MAG: hypothetical protein WA082_04520 [Candidatus Moraniibacteriota bacterium]
MENKKWQNLIYRKCPGCDTALNAAAKRGRLVFECPTDGCGFAIHASSYVRILMDKTHILRKFLTKDEEAALEKALSVESLSTNQKTL